MKHFIIGCLLMVSTCIQAQYSIDGHVLNKDKSTPIENAAISWNENVVLTDAQGAFTIEGTAGQVVVTCHSMGYEHWTDTLDLQENIHLDILLVPTIMKIGTAFVEAPAIRENAVTLAPIQMIQPQLQMYRGQSQSLGALLTAIPGVSSIATGVNASQPSIRGVHGTRVAIIVDGIPQQNQQWGDDHGSDLDPWMAERIEVHKSSGNIQLGTNASGGAIVINPGPMLNRNASEVGAFLRGQSVNNGLEGGVKLAHRWQKLQLEGVAIFRDYADLSVPADTFVYLTRHLPLYDRQLVNTSGSGDSQRLRLRYETDNHGWRLEARRSNLNYGIFPGIFGIPSLGDLQGDGDERATQLPQMVSEHRAVSLHGHHNSASSYWKYSFGYQNSYRAELGPPHGHGNGPLPTDSLALELDLDAFFASFENRKELESGRLLRFGMQWEFLESRSSGWEFLVSSYSSQNIGAYAALSKIQIGEGYLSAGVRYDMATVRTDEFQEFLYNESQEVTGTTVRSQGVGELFSAMSANLLYQGKARAHFNWAIQLNRAMRFPNAYELAANGVHHGTFRHDQGNPDLSPEIGYGGELNLNSTYERMSVRLSPFSTYYTNYVYLTPAAQFSSLPHAGQLYRFEQNQAIRSGAEMEIDYLFNPRFALEIDAAYVFGWNLDASTGLPWTPPFNAFSELNIAPFKSLTGLHLKPSMEFAAAQNNVARNEEKSEAYIIAGAALAWQSSNFSFTINANNLFNKSYINHMSRYKLIQLPEAGRNIGFQLIYSFKNQTK